MRKKLKENEKNGDSFDSNLFVVKKKHSKNLNKMQTF